MADSSTSETLTRLLQWLGGLLVISGGVLGWAKHKLVREKQFVELGLIAAQTEESKANAHKITVDSLIQSANERKADLERVTKDREHWRGRAEAAEAEKERLQAEIERLLREAQVRHEWVNELNAYRMREVMIKKAGMSYEEAQAQPVEPIYPEAEEE